MKWLLRILRLLPPAAGDNQDGENIVNEEPSERALREAKRRSEASKELRREIAETISRLEAGVTVKTYDGQKRSWK